MRSGSLLRTATPSCCRIRGWPVIAAPSMYACTHTHTHTRSHTYTAGLSSLLHLCTPVHTHTHSLSLSHTHTAALSLLVHLCGPVYTHTHTHTHTHLHTHTHSYTHTNGCMCVGLSIHAPRYRMLFHGRLIRYRMRLSHAMKTPHTLPYASIACSADAA
jgi:hypothetical protein